LIETGIDGMATAIFVKTVPVSVTGIGARTFERGVHKKSRK
jgi:hypothetical protein